MNNYPKDLKAKGDYVLFDPLPDFIAPKDLIIDEVSLMKQKVIKPEGLIVSVGSEAEKRGFKAGQKIYFEENKQRRFYLGGKLYGTIKGELIQMTLPDDYILQNPHDQVPLPTDMIQSETKPQSKIHLVN